MIISVVSTKGGVGKSTFITNLSAYLVNATQDCLLIDSDRQGTSSKWNFVRNAYREQGENMAEIAVMSASGKALLEVALQQSADGKIVLIDTAGVDSTSTREAILKSDYVITLSSPSLADVWEVSEVLELCRNAGKVRKHKLPLALVFNKCSTHNKVNSLQEAQTFLEENLYVPDYIFENVIHERIAYQHAIRAGESVFEYEKNGTAAKEFKQICEEFMQLLSIK